MEYTLEKEKVLKRKLDSLFQTWDERMRKNGATEEEISYWCSDGFYPGYSLQKVKVLFIGREPRYLADYNFIEITYEGIKKNEIRVKNKTLTVSQHPYFSKLFYITYGVNNNLCEKIPSASEMITSFGNEDGISYAYMNLSKFSNEDDGYATNWKNVNRFLALSEGEENLCNKEIQLLNPDIIITMNFGNWRVKKYLGVIANDYGRDEKGNIHKYELQVGEKTIPLFDMWHFSAPGKDFEECYYLPLRKFLEKNISEI